MDVLLKQVDDSVAQLEKALLASSASDDITPLILIEHSARPSREDELRQRYMQLGMQHLHLVQIEERLKAIRRRVFRQQTLCTDALAPISALPHELICRILRHAAASREYPTVRELARVNREWRNAALHDPELWSHLTIPGDRFVQIASSMARGPLSYTPLHLFVKDRDTIRIPLHLVKALQSRLVSARFTSSDGPAILGALDRALKYHPEGLAVLESLVISLPTLCSACDYESAHPQGGTLLHLDDIRFPKLRALELQRCIVRLTTCNSLLTLKLSDVVVLAHDLHQLLTHCSSVTAVSLNGVDIRGGPFQGTRVSLAALQTLEVTRTYAHSAAQALAILHAPALVKFVLTHIEPVSEDVTRDFERGEMAVEARLFVEFRILTQAARHIRSVHLPTPLHCAKAYLWTLLPRIEGGFVALAGGRPPLPALEHITIGTLARHDEAPLFEQPQAHAAMIAPVAQMLENVAIGRPPMRWTILACVRDRLSERVLGANTIDVVRCPTCSVAPAPVDAESVPMVVMGFPDLD